MAEDWSAKLAAVKVRANAALGDDMDITAMREVYEGEILEWTDELVEADAGADADAATARTAQEIALVDLWLAFADAECELRQFKAAVKAYESATECDVAKQYVRPWKAWADFCVARNKVSNAQRIYLRALAAVAPGSAEAAAVWESLLELVRAQGQPELTAEALKTAMGFDADGRPLEPPPDGGSSSPSSPPPSVASEGAELPGSDAPGSSRPSEPLVEAGAAQVHRLERSQEE